MEVEFETTVDPSYVIRLIRQLLPQQQDADEDSEKCREEAGCTLWDLSASEAHAELMVGNYILEVLLAVLRSTNSERIAEICIGILGNVACHEKLASLIIEKGLLPTIIEQLRDGTDPQILIETCRLINAGLHSEFAESWIAEVQSDAVLERILWIVQNTLNFQLQEKSIELLLAMVDSRKKAAPVLLPPLMRLGLLPCMTSLMKSELEALNNGKSDAVLDLLLQVAQEVSLSDAFGDLLAADGEFRSGIFQVIQVAAEDEAPSALSAMLVLANLLVERAELIQDLCGNPALVEHLLQLLHSATTDAEIELALWNIIRCICKFTVSSLEPNLVAVIANGSRKLVSNLENDDRPRLRELKREVINDVLELLTASKQQEALAELLNILN